MGDDGVMGYIEITSLVAWATYAAASFPSSVTLAFSDIFLISSPELPKIPFGTDIEPRQTQVAYLRFNITIKARVQIFNTPR
jgi:hypothetical protein